MDFMTCIKERRSCRNFLPTAVEKDKLEQVLQAGLYAPSPVNKQPWEFIVVTNADLKEQFKRAAELILPKLAEKSGWKWLNSYTVEFLTQAAVYIVVVGDPEKNGAEQFLDQPGMAYQEACSAAVQNILLAAQGLGLASLWYSLYEKADAKEIFGVAAGKDPFAVICLGYAAAPSSMPRRKELEEKVRYLE